MLYGLRTGDILLAENKATEAILPYLITYDSEEGYSILCLTCGQKVGSYGENKALFLKDIKEFLNVVGVVPKELMIDFFNKNYKLKYPVKKHDINEKYELGLDFELE